MWFSLAALAPMIVAATVSAPSAPVSWGHLQPGSFAVGYEGRYVIDDTRSFGARNRPIQMRLWYPAREKKGTALRASDYLALRTPEALSDVAAAFADRNRGI